MRHLTTIPFIFILLIFTTVLITGSALSAAKTDDGTPVETSPTTANAKPLYGPILSNDPATRILIMDLYQDLENIKVETRVKLGELNQTYAQEASATLRQDLAREMGDLKHSLEIRNMEIGLQIARLNGQTQRADEFELALDQILNPEKYFPANRPDPALKAARLRENGQK